MRYWLIAVPLLAVPSVVADSRFSIAIAARPGLPPARGQCDIRLEIDREVEITVRRDVVLVRTVAGENARDGGSDCDTPLPDRGMRNFAIQTVDGRGETRILERPSARNDYALVLRVNDAAEGFGRYRFRLSWESSPAFPTGIQPAAFQQTGDRPDAPEGFVWNNATEYKGHGSGETVLNDGAGQPLADVRVGIDLGGKIVVSFTPDKRRGGASTRPVLFTGSVTTRDGSTIHADMVTQDHRLHGAMTLTVDDKHNVHRIAMNATDGQDHLRLTWDRR